MKYLSCKFVSMKRYLIALLTNVECLSTKIGIICILIYVEDSEGDFK